MCQEMVLHGREDFWAVPLYLVVIDETLAGTLHAQLLLRKSRIQELAMHLKLSKPTPLSMLWYLVGTP